MSLRRFLLLLASAFVLCCAPIPEAVARPGGVPASHDGDLHGAPFPQAHSNVEESENFGPIIPMMIAGIFIAILVSLNNLIVSRAAGSAPEVIQNRDRSNQDDADDDLEQSLRELVSDDPDFSMIAFLDFAHALWQETRLRTGTPELQRLRPYYGLTAMERLAPAGFTADRQDPPGRNREDRIDEVVVRSLRVDRIVRRRFSGPSVGSALPVEVFRLVVVLEDSWRHVTSEGPLQRLFEDVKLVFERATGVRSKAPEGLFVVCCQSCGGTLPDELGERCPYCGQDYRSPGFNWHCTEVVQRTNEVLTFGGQVEREAAVDPGYRLPTLVSASLEDDLRKMERDEPDFRSRFGARAREVFERLYVCWDAADLEGMRPFLTERLLGTYQFWIEGYREAGLRNHLRGQRLLSMDLARITRDRWFDSVTVRIKSCCFNEVVEVATGRLVSGSPRYPHYHSEYWTFARSAVRAEAAPCACPRCGAAHVPMEAAFCAHCGSRIVVSTAAWVLSIVEQAGAVRQGHHAVEGTEKWRRLWPPMKRAVPPTASTERPKPFPGLHAEPEEHEKNRCHF